jgi:predicted amidophosphoribosyltransferase
VEACPTCKRPFRRSHRFCYACEKPILRGHKFHHNGCYIQHDDCSNPTLDLRQETPLLLTQNSEGDNE